MMDLLPKEPWQGRLRARALGATRALLAELPLTRLSRTEIGLLEQSSITFIGCRQIRRRTSPHWRWRRRELPSIILSHKSLDPLN
jgi:hypothetical protein